MAPKWKSSIPIAGVAAAAALAFPGIANATVTSAVVNGTELTVTSDAADAITIASNGATATVNGAPVGGATAATLTKITVTGNGGVQQHDRPDRRDQGRVPGARRPERGDAQRRPRQRHDHRQ